MKRSVLALIIISSLICMGSFNGCGASGSSDNSSSAEKTSSASEASSEGDAEKVSDASPEFNDWEIVEPEEGSEEYDLGPYRVSPTGTKLYYEDNEYPRELVLVLEKYFKSIEIEDYETYKECIFPTYIEEMEKSLQKEYQYGLDKSFRTQCDNLRVNGGDGYTITRIKVEPPLEVESEEAGAEAFLDNLNEFFGEDYKSSVKADSDALRYMTFHVMSKNAEGEESMLLSEFYILFAEKDGKYYTFG